MAWVLYRWVWRVESPLHIGMPPAGALNRTRLYVPARALWGALTAELARRRNPNQFPDYASVGKSVQAGIRLSYLFPAEPVGRDWKAWLPRYEKGRGLVWQREEDHETLEDRLFRMRLLITQSGTAIEPESDTALEGTLREFELISPYWQNSGDIPKQVAMVGYMFCRDQRLWAEIYEVQELFVGGDIRYGFGRLTRIACNISPQFFDGVPVDLQATSPAVITSRILAHAVMKPGSDLIGAIECLSGWDMVQGGLKHPELVWAPGSSLSRDQKFNIKEDGLWEL